MSDVVCGKCIVHESLQELIHKKGARATCTLCKRSNRKVHTIEDVAKHIFDRLRADYSYAVEVMPLGDGLTGKDTWTLLDDLQLGCEDEVLQAIHDEIDEGEPWCDRDINGTPGEILAAGWDEFQTVVKHQIRYFLAEHSERSVNNPSVDPPIYTLELAAKLFDEHNLFTTLTAGSTVYRVRDVAIGAAVPTKPSEFGPPPVTVCVQSNRMNPPGISAMYVSPDQDTCVAEVPIVDDRRRFLATFEVKRDILLLDITNIPRPPRFLDDGDPNDRHMLEFLDAFSTMCALPVERDNRAHVGYVPTQVVCEYLMHKFKDRGVKGIKYPSTKGAGDNVALFVPSNCIEEESGRWQLGKPLFRLINSREV